MCSEEEDRLKKLFLKREKLYKAALKGDWKTAKSIFDTDPSAVTMKLTDNGKTVLYIAMTAKQTAFAEKLVNLMSSSDLTSSDFILAMFYRNKDIASLLLSKTNFEALDRLQQTDFLLATIHNDYYDLALEIREKNPQLANMEALNYLAIKADAIGSSGKLSFWKRCINYGFKGLYNKDLMQTLAHQLVQNLWNDVIKDFTKEELLKFINTKLPLLVEAARVGNVEFLIILINSFPYLLSASSVIQNNYKDICYTAIKNRQESIFSLIYETGPIVTDSKVLELAGKIADPKHLNRIPGAALQMQLELSWFKEVEKTVPHYYREEKFLVGRDGDKTEELTGRELFTKDHKQLLKDGEEWMKSTANSCMLVATLIATVVFAAAFTVPGGIDNNTGTPIFRQKDSFTIFIISDVTALVSSTTSILIFLSILTSRYTEDDFLVSLPRKLLFGMVTLFFSIVCMIVAFSATIFMVYNKAKSEILLAIIVGAIIPVCCFCRLHTNLVLDILRSTGWFGFSSRFHKRRLFI